MNGEHIAKLQDAKVKPLVMTAAPEATEGILVEPVWISGTSPPINT